MPEENHSQLESMYDDPAWKEAQYMDPYRKVKRWTWRVAGVLALAMLMIAFVFGMLAGSDFMVGILIVALLFFLCLLVAAIVSVLLAFIPIKHINYIERVYIWLPIITVVAEVALILLWLYMERFAFG